MPRSAEKGNGMVSDEVRTLQHFTVLAKMCQVHLTHIMSHGTMSVSKGSTEVLCVGRGKEVRGDKRGPVIPILQLLGPDLPLQGLC